MFLMQPTPKRIARAILFLIIFLSFCTMTLQASAEESLLISLEYSSDFINSMTREFKIDSSTQDNLKIINSNQVETFTIDIPQLERKDRSIIVFLPTGYFSGNSSYPVLYVQGAQDLFMHSGVSDSDWYVDESLLQFYSSGFSKDFIIVGIPSDPIHYWDEYSPWVNDNMYLWMDPYDANRIEGGQGDAYLQFLTQTLKPVIDERYRTLENQENTGIAGYQMGGLISLYAGLTMPEIFSTAMALSPSVWFAEAGGLWLSNNRLLQLINDQRATPNVTFHLDIAKKDKTTELVVRPVIYDDQNQKISFPQAYLEGTQATIKGLINSGLPKNNISGSLTNPDQWSYLIEESLERDNLAGFVYYFPLFSNPPVPPQITSVSATTFVIDHNNEFTFTTISSSIPTISYTGTLPVGVSFMDNEDGTATLSYSATGLDVVGVYPITISADNGTPPAAIQYFELRIASPSGLACPTNDSCILSFDMPMTPFLSRTRTIWVYLPPNYNTGGEKYQVIYLTDAQHIFGSEIGVPLESIWDLTFDETLDDLYDQTGTGTIAVAIEYDADYPWDEYSPWNNSYMSYWIGSNSQNFRGVGNSFLNFIVYELKPTIDSSYRTRTEREYTAIGGGSRCGLFAIYAGLREPTVFSKVMALSPAIWLANNSTNFWYTNNGLKLWFDNNRAPTDVRYYQYVGTSEGLMYHYADGVNLVKNELIKDGVMTIETYVNPGGTHHPGVWAPFVDDALKWLGFY
jgi:predicted alpha/beta superfamily hydrolase